MKWLLLIFVIVLFGCKREKENQDINKHEIFCDSDFDVFFEKFKIDSLYQKEHIEFPLKLTYYEDTSGRDVYIVDEYVKVADVRNKFSVPHNGLRTNFKIDFEGSILRLKDTV